MRKSSARFILLALCIFGLLGRNAPRADAQDAPPTPLTPTPDGRFGAIESFWAPQEAAELDVGWERILFYWNEIQPTGPEDWNTLHVLEEWLVEANVQGRTVLGLLKNTPAWATDETPFSGVPRGLYLPIDDPQNLWANYVRRVVDYYAARGVHHWIVWNEPEIEPGVYGHEFGGSVEDYYRLLKVAYLVAKETDPQAVIHLAGWSYWHDPEYLREFLDVATADAEGAAHGYYFDVLSLHIYFRVETVQELVTEVDRVQNEYGLDKPIWINETNASPNLDPWWPVERPQFQVDLDQQAWYLAQAFALGFGAGAERIGVYKLIDILLPEGGESFGILRPDYSQRPAFLAYRTIIEQLRGFREPVYLQQFPDYYSVSFTVPEGVTRVLWARRDRTVTVDVPALGTTAVLVDVLGRESGIIAVDGLYTLQLEGARCRGACDIGGPPLFLVERGATLAAPPPTSAAPPQLATLTPTPLTPPTYTPWPTASPTASSTPTATLTPTASPTPTASSTPTPIPTATSTPIPSLTPAPTSTLPAQSTATAPQTGRVELTAWWVFGAAGLLTLIFAAFWLLRR